MFLSQRRTCAMGAVGVRLPSTGRLIKAHKGTAQSHAPLFHPLALAAGSPLFPLLLSRVISKVILIMKAGSGFFSTVQNALLSNTVVSWL